MQNSRQQQTIETRLRIIESAAHQFAHKGFDGASFSDVAKSVDMTKQAVMHHFPSKQLLKSAVIHYTIEKSQSVFPKLQAILTEKNQTSEWAMLEDLLSKDLQNTDWASFLLKEVVNHTEIKLGEDMLQWSQFLIQSTKNAKAIGHLQDDIDAEAAVTNISLMILGVLATLHTSPAGYIPEKIDQKTWKIRKLKELFRLVRSGLYAIIPD